jgi:hypothetical protein
MVGCDNDCCIVVSVSELSEARCGHGSGVDKAGMRDDKRYGRAVNGLGSLEQRFNGSPELFSVGGIPGAG